jgi:rare lipoprotein A
MQLRFHHWHGIALLLIASVLALTGCGSVPRSSSAPGAKSLPVLPPAGSGRGGYYKDDGPGAAPPDGLEAMPDAEPRVEAYAKKGNRPYAVFGKTYTPITDDRPFKQRGLGSWYGKKFHGQKTSSGEIYDMYKMTAAHPTLPIPSYARVTNIGNGVQVIVRVNDRGPFHSGRIIDLSYTAALKLGYIAKGSTLLEVERLLPEEIARIAGNKQNRRDASQAVAPALPAPAGLPVAASRPAAAMQPEQATATAIPADAATTGNFYLQLGAYGQAANAEAVRSQLEQNWVSTLPPPQVAQNGTLYRIYTGPFTSRSEADSAAQQVQAIGGDRPVIVQRY